MRFWVYYSISLFLPPDITGPSPHCVGASWCRGRMGWMPEGSWSVLGPVCLGRARRAAHEHWNMWLS